MYIFIDESGSFTTATETDSWCVVTAFAIPESQIEKLEKLMQQLRIEHGLDEVKLKHLSEARYIRFLKDLSKLYGLAFSVGTDISLHTEIEVREHQNNQADKIIEHRWRMKYESMRNSMDELSLAIRSLPPQLYTQLQCQVELFHKVLTRTPIYYSQHAPHALEKFQWRIDQKNTIPTAYEDAFRKILPASLKSKSLNDPIVVLVEGDSSFLKRFEITNSDHLKYLETEYGIKTSGQGFDVKKIISEDFQLQDSKQVSGIQVADLLASGTRRLMKGGFVRSHEVALLLGSNMLMTKRNEPLIRLITLGKTSPTSSRSTHFLEVMKRTCKPLV